VVASGFVWLHEVTWGFEPGHGGGGLLPRRSWSVGRIKVANLGFLLWEDDELPEAVPF
jgi:hypothetical protein